MQVQYAGNIREKIAQRALACCVEPGIVFDYDHRLKGQCVFELFSTHRSNCETFCNMVIFNIPQAAQSEDVAGCVKGGYY